MYDRQDITTLAILLLTLAGHSSAAPPRVTDGKYDLKLIASEPEIVTPIGLAFDRQGRLFIVESHTHQRPGAYKGPASDRIRMLADSDGDGRLDKWSTFADGFRHALNLLVRDDSSVYVVTRHNIELLRDTDNDGDADTRDELLRLETEDDYPHNGLGGLAKHTDGSLVVSMGENHGLPYRLIGADGKEIAAAGGRDGFFHIEEDGKNLHLIATGVWNPVSVCVVPDGRVFAVDNDPDSSPPCRLLHVIYGGDYGYLYQYGRAGTHPLQAWNGELPGTLPMVSGTGEAPTAIVPHAGALWVTSWGDHRIERYRLVPRGVSYGAERKIVVQGNSDFRPTGMAIAPDGSLYFGDWVLRDYEVHGKGRIWRLNLPADEVGTPFPRPSQADMYSSGDPEFAMGDADSDDAFGRANAAYYIMRGDIQNATKTPGLRLCALQAKRTLGASDPLPMLREALHDESVDVRLYAVRWIADDRITALKDDVVKLLEGPQPSPRYYLALLAAVDWLSHEPRMTGNEITDALLVGELKNKNRTPDAHALALSLLKPDNKFLTLDRLRNYLQSEHASLRLEAIRSLAQQSNPKRFELLAPIAQDDSQDQEVRAEAIVGLGAAAAEYHELLQRLASTKSATLRREAERTLRLSGLQRADAESKPPVSDVAAWAALLGTTGDTASGRRLFFSPVAGRCSVCHAHAGRGGSIGPDLTHIGRNTARERIIASILQPSQEIAPNYQPWTLTTTDGITHTGLRLPRPGDSGEESFTDSAGKVFTLASATIEERQASTTSIMPDGLEKTLSIEDLRDLVAFLASSN